MSNDGQILFLEVRGADWTKSVELRVGTRVVIGRGDTADLRIDRKSVSSEHLAISWDGQGIFIQDLNSSYGTFRMPQDSPFKEARFPSQFEDLELRLAHESIQLSWSLSREKLLEQTALMERTATLQERTALAQEKTAVSQDRTALSQEKTEVSKPEGSKLSQSGISDTPAEGLPPSSEVGEVAKVVPEVAEAGESVSEKSSPLRSTVPWKKSLVALPFALTLLWVAIRWRAIFFLSPSAALHGAFLDVLILYMQNLVWAGALAVGGFLLARRFSASESLAKRPASVFFALALLWPFVAAGLLGYSPKRWLAAVEAGSAAMHLQNLKHASVGELNQEAEFWRDRKVTLQGSSFVFKRKFDLQRERVLRDCDGVGGDRPWSNKRSCLILLVAITVEDFQESRPVVLGQVAERAIFLLSLDGLSRVADAEGLESNNFEPFLDSLASIGLLPEEKDMRVLLANKELSKEMILRVIGELRRRIEGALESQQASLGIPPELRLQVPGPLESGI